MDCFEGVEAAQITEHPAFCTQGGPTCLRKLFGQARNGAFVTEAVQQHHRNISWFMLIVFFATLTIAVIADIIGQDWSRNALEYEMTEDKVLPCTLWLCGVLSIICLTNLLMMPLDISTANSAASYHLLVEANVERILPNYEDFRMSCSAQLSLPLDDGSIMHRDLKVDCRNGLEVAHKTHTVTVLLQRPFRTSELSLVRQADLDWTTFNMLNYLSVSLRARHQYFVHILGSLGLLILRGVAVQAPKCFHGICRWWAVRRTISPDHLPMSDRYDWPITSS